VKIIWRKEADHTYHVGVHTVTPVAQSIGLRWQSGGWLWQFPLAIEMKNEENGAHRWLPIPDPTRAIVWGLYALTLVVAIAAARRAWRKGQRARQERIKVQKHV
jgi:hypothetical protein